MSNTWTDVPALVASPSTEIASLPQAQSPIYICIRIINHMYHIRVLPIRIYAHTIIRTMSYIHWPDSMSWIKVYTASCIMRCTFSFNAHVNWGCVYRWMTCRQTENHDLKLVLGTDSDHILCCIYTTCCTFPLFICRVPGDVVEEGEMVVTWPFVSVVPWQLDNIAIKQRVAKYGRNSCGWWMK